MESHTHIISNVNPGWLDAYITNKSESFANAFKENIKNRADILLTAIKESELYQNSQRFKTDINEAIYKVTDSIIASYIDPNGPKVITQGLRDAIRNNRIEFVRGEEAINSNDIHAEMKLTQKLLDKRAVDIISTNNNSYIGISKRCCPKCEGLIKSINKVMSPSGSGIEPIHEVVERRNESHFSAYPTGIPKFLEYWGNKMPKEIIDNIRTEFLKEFWSSMSSQPQISSNKQALIEAFNFKKIMKSSRQELTRSTSPEEGVRDFSMMFRTLDMVISSSRSGGQSLGIGGSSMATGAALQVAAAFSSSYSSREYYNTSQSRHSSNARGTARTESNEYGRSSRSAEGTARNSDRNYRASKENRRRGSESRDINERGRSRSRERNSGNNSRSDVSSSDRFNREVYEDRSTSERYGEPSSYSSSNSRDISRGRIVSNSSLSSGRGDTLRRSATSASDVNADRRGVSGAAALAFSSSSSSSVTSSDSCAWRGVAGATGSGRLPAATASVASDQLSAATAAHRQPNANAMIEALTHSSASARASNVNVNATTTFNRNPNYTGQNQGKSR